MRRMPPPTLLDRFLRAESWWLIRGESGALWPTLFHPRGVIAHGRLVPRFPEDADLETRERAMLVLDSFGQKEVNDFNDVMDEGDVIITPDAGSRSAWFGVVTSPWFAAADCEHWIQRRCDWHPAAVPLTPEATDLLPRTPQGTVFNVSRAKPVLMRCLTKAAGTSNSLPHR